MLEGNSNKLNKLLDDIKGMNKFDDILYLIHPSSKQVIKLNSQEQKNLMNIFSNP